MSRWMRTASETVKLAADIDSLETRVAREFPTPEALKKYLHEHPNADRHKHKVVKKEPPKPKLEKVPHQKGAPLFTEEERNLGEDVKQKVNKPNALFREAKKAHELQLDWLNRGKGLDSVLGAKVVRGDRGDFNIDYDKPGPVILIGPPKSKKRSVEKIEGEMGGDWSKLGDIVRSSIAVDSMDDIEKTMAALRKSGLKLARKPKDRFAKPTSAGYRDLMMSVVYPNGHIGELQLHLKPVLKAKDAGHKYYEDVRTIEGKAQKEGRKFLTEEEQKVVDEANAKMKKLYDDAWAEATKHGQKESKVAAGPTKFYEYHELPAVCERYKFPISFQPRGKKTVYDLEEFFREAKPISEKEFDALTEKTHSKGGEE